MRENIGTLDRFIRIFLSLGLFALAGLPDPGLRWLSVLGVLPLATVLVGCCPLYRALHLSTLKHS